MTLPADADVHDDAPVSDFRIAIGAQPGGEAGVVVTYEHVRWLFTPDKATEFASAVIEAAAQARRHGKGDRP